MKRSSRSTEKKKYPYSTRELEKLLIRLGDASDIPARNKKSAESCDKRSSSLGSSDQNMESIGKRLKRRKLNEEVQSQPSPPSLAQTTSTSSHWAKVKQQHLVNVRFRIYIEDCLFRALVLVPGVSLL